MLTRKTAFLLIVLSLFFAAAAATRAQLRFEQWNEENGLPQNWMKGILQTRDGFLWLTTGQGAARFDGVRFKVFNRSNTAAMASDRFSLYAIHEDRAGNLWMGTEDGGVIVERDGVFSSITSAQGLPDDGVFRIDEDANGAIWIYTANGLAKWENGKLTKIAPMPDSPFNKFLNAPPNFGAEAKYFGFWRADSAGWERFAHGKWERFPLPPEVKNTAQAQIGTLIEDAKRRVWYSLREKPQQIYLVENGVLTKLPELAAARSFFYRDSQERFWILDRNNNLAFIKNEKITSLNIAPPGFKSVFEDREGTIWATTENRGLYQIKKRIVDVYTNPNGANNMQPLMQDRAGNVWVGSGGLARFDNGIFENFYHAGLSRSPTFERNVLISLFEDTDGSFWLGVRDGIVRFRNGILERDENLSAQIKGWIHAIYRDRTGDLWFGSEEGLYCLDRAGKLTRYGIENGLPSPHVRVILEDKNGTVWFGTVGGLARKTENGFAALGEADGITPARISSLYEDAQGFLWIGTYDGVLYRLKTEAGAARTVRYATEQGLPYDAIHKILEDDAGFFWIGGQRGIYRYRRQELDEIAAGQPIVLTATRLGKDDGLLSASINSWGQPAGFKARDGKLWFPSEDGIAVIDPRDLPFNSAAPPVLIEDCLIDRELVGCAPNLQIKPNQENLEINYLALSFIKPEQMRFKYRLEGLDADWIEAGTRRTAYYSHLPSGDYTFRVIAANSDGVWNETGKSLTISVLPPFYRTRWFIAACLLIIGCAAFLIYKIRINQVEKRRRAQEDFSRRLINAHEAERRRVAAELHDSIGQTLAMIKNRAVFGAQTTENLAAAHEQFDSITAQTTQAIGEVREISYNLRPYLLEQLGLTKAVKSLVKKIEEVHLLEIEARIDEVDDLLSNEAEMSVYRIIQESLNNVAKHAETDAARLLIRRIGDSITIIVSDDGRGFDKNAAPKIDASRGGFGLLGITERVRMLGGTLDIQTANGGGTKLTIKIALSSK